MSAPARHSAYPEWLTRDDVAPEAWNVEEGNPIRGDAWTNLTAHTMRVPMGDDPTSRAVRAHEMVHAKVSPKVLDRAYAEANKVDMDILIAAEEFRVNGLATEAGFDMDALVDGSESKSGSIVAQNKDWNGAVRMVAACAGTKGATDFIRGVAKHDKDMAASLRALNTKMKKDWKKDLQRYKTHRIGDTTVKQDGQMPEGFHKFTLKYAKYLQTLLINEGEQGDAEEGNEIPKPSDVKSSNERGKFAKLIELEVPKPNKVDGRIGRKRTPSQIGKNPRRISRVLTDPDKRIFDKRTKGKGGVVLIDQSGSMDLREKDIWRIIEHAPGCVIIGYSHSPGSTDRPNVWVIADRGRVADHVPDGNGGNGVDGPAVTFAAKRLRTGEPFIWVCDGIVTDGASDHHYYNLDIEAAKLVKKHRIHMTNDVDGAVEALKGAARGKRPEMAFTGMLAEASSRLGDTDDE